MDRLEQYLDQICRSIGGPKSLRQHVRQELREHLLDAAARHKAAGLPETQALERALADFGGPDEVRTELEELHGHRLLPVVIDKAMQWKEQTMKAKWLWASWAYLGLITVIALEVLFVTFNVVFIIPKFQKLMQDGMIDGTVLSEHGLGWIVRFLNDLSYVAGHYTTQLLLAVAAAWGLFEWRVRSENKPFMRLSALGTAATGLMAVAAVMGASLAVVFTLAMPAFGRMSRSWAIEQVSAVDMSVFTLEFTLARKDWKTMDGMYTNAIQAMNRLSEGPAAAFLTSGNRPPTAEELRALVEAAKECMREMQPAVQDQDAARMETALKRFRQIYEPVLEAAKRNRPAG